MAALESRLQAWAQAVARLRCWLAIFVLSLGCAAQQATPPRAPDAPTAKETSVSGTAPPVSSPVEAPATAPAAEAPREPVALVLVLDRSGSMSGEAIEQARRACHEALEELAPDDIVAVIAFDAAPMVYVPARAVGDGSEVRAGIDRIRAAGGTDILPALESAFAILREVSLAERRVLLLSDGMAPIEGIRELVRTMRGEKIIVSAIGLGDSYDRTLLDEIAREGGGRFRSVAHPADLPAVFRREASDLVAAPGSSPPSD